jgi:hypothetical protein
LTGAQAQKRPKIVGNKNICDPHHIFWKFWGIMAAVYSASIIFTSEAYRAATAHFILSGHEKTRQFQE